MSNQFTCLNCKAIFHHFSVWSSFQKNSIVQHSRCNSRCHAQISKMRSAVSFKKGAELLVAMNLLGRLEPITTSLNQIWMIKCKPADHHVTRRKKFPPVLPPDWLCSKSTINIINEQILILAVWLKFGDPSTCQSTIHAGTFLRQMDIEFTSLAF